MLYKPLTSGVFVQVIVLLVLGVKVSPPLGDVTVMVLLGWMLNTALDVSLMIG